MGKELANIIVVHGEKNACYHYRIAPYLSIKSDVKFTLCQQLYESGFKDTDEIDGVVFQRPCDANILKFIKDYNKEGGITVVETDDDMLNIPYDNPVHGFVKSDHASIYSECLKHAKYIHCSTPELSVGGKSTVFYNAIDLKKYINPLPKKEQSVFWQGSNTHADSLELIRPVIQELLNDGVNVVLINTKEGWLEKIFKPHKNLTILNPVHFDAFYRTCSMAMVNLAPLTDNKFNRSKSELRILEAAAWKIPTVSSAVSPYIRFNKLSDGGSLIVSKERTKNWLDAIYLLLNNKEKYKECSEKSYLCVEKHYNLEVVNKQRADWWSGILSKQMV